MKQGQIELGYIVFLAVFIAFLTIISSIFLVPVIDEEIQNNNGWLSSLLAGIQGIPILGGIVTLFKTIYGFSYVHPYLGIILTAITTVPLGYLIIRLIRGGG